MVDTNSILEQLERERREREKLHEIRLSQILEHEREERYSIDRQFQFRENRAIQCHNTVMPLLKEIAEETERLARALDQVDTKSRQLGVSRPSAVHRLKKWLGGKPR